MRDSAEKGITRRGAVRLAGAAASSLALSCLAGCSDGGSGDGGDGGSKAKDAVLRMAISVDPDGLDPQRTASASTFQITNNLYDPLLRVTTSGDIVEGLAKAWEVGDDGLTITFHLREGLKFSNGMPCDAIACAASFERLQDPASPRRSEYEGYSFEAVDDTTLVVTSRTLNVAALTDFAYAWSAVVEVTAGDTLASKPVGTGPYTLAEWTPRQSVVLEANPGYWGAQPLCPRVELRVLPNSTSQVGSLRAGQIDMMLATSEQVAPFEGDASFRIVQQPTNGVQLMAMNCRNKALSDVRVRRAINHAVNKDELIESVWWGYGAKIGSHYPVCLKGYVDCNDLYPYDPQAARDLLSQAGYADGLTLRMRLPQSYTEYVNTGQVIADALGKVGVTCKIEIVEWATWLEEVYTGHDYDLTVIGHTGRLDPITLLARYTSDSTENYFGFEDAEVDRLVALYRGELDEAVRMGYVEQIQRRLAQEVPAVYLQDPEQAYICAADVRGFEVYPIDIYEFGRVSVGA